MLKRIAVTDLCLGMYIQEFIGSWTDHPFWRGRFLLSSERDLQKVRSSRITELVINLELGCDVPAVNSEPLNAEAAEPIATSAVEPELSNVPVKELSKPELRVELEHARELCARSKQAIVAMFREARMGRAVEVEQATELVEEISASVMRHPDAFISLARLKHSDEYTYMHSVAVCALMIALARQLGMSHAQVREAGVAGLLHDVGKMAIPDAILNKPGDLSDDEYNLMRGHSQAGAKLLENNAEVSAAVLDVCLHHHEKYDGSGYPHRLAGEKISQLARMGAICDVYDAVTSNRVYRDGWSPADAIARMAQWAGHFDPYLFQAFVKSVGIYPTGSLVRLHSERLAVVLEQNHERLLMPKVKVFYSTRMRQAIATEVVDLLELQGQDKIVSRELPETWGLSNIDSLWLD